MKIFLVGYMGSGKTTAGRKLASLLGYTFIDIDSMIESETGRSVVEWFKMGEPKFREVETLVLQQTADFPDAVIATGGGTACYHENMKWMKEHGLTVYLKMSEGAIFHRLMNSKSERPLLKGKTDVELMEYITESLREREYFYSKAHYIVPGENMDVKKLLEEIKTGEAQLR